ncbi:MAG: hypothetical protein Q8O41_01535 [Candidatus Methanoperedens sp.]|nr:hypothetical protein [Candidatus Methanoperedens sp.]
MDAREATKVVREYFDSIKKIKFIFDVRDVKFDEEDDMWIVTCDVQNLFGEEPISYGVGVDDETGDIQYVEKIE